MEIEGGVAGRSGVPAGLDFPLPVPLLLKRFKNKVSGVEMTSEVSDAFAKKATIHEVARRAGVSIGTVSLALNGSTRCSPVTARRVREAAEALNYLPNHAARSLRSQSTETIALVIPDIGNPVYVAMARAVQEVVKSRGYHLSLISTDGHVQEEVHALGTLSQRRVDGMILCSLRMTEPLVAALKSAPGPVAVIGALAEVIRTDNVQVNSEYGVALAIDHLVGQHRRRIAFLNGPADTVPATIRGRGYTEALRRHGLDRPRTCHAEYSVAGGHQAAGTLLEEHPDLDALFCANDLMAIGAMKRLRELGRRVPDDVAVVGMDDIPEGLICTPTLSTVSLLATERARIAATMLLDRLTGASEHDVQSVMVTPTLIVRESSRMAGKRP